MYILYMYYLCMNINTKPFILMCWMSSAYNGEVISMIDIPCLFPSN